MNLSLGQFWGQKPQNFFFVMLAGSFFFFFPSFSDVATNEVNFEHNPALNQNWNWIIVTTSLWSNLILK